MNQLLLMAATFMVCTRRPPLLTLRALRSNNHLLESLKPKSPSSILSLLKESPTITTISVNYLFIRPKSEQVPFRQQAIPQTTSYLWHANQKRRKVSGWKEEPRLYVPLIVDKQNIYSIITVSLNWNLNRHYNNNPTNFPTNERSNLLQQSI